MDKKNVLLLMLIFLSIGLFSLMYGLFFVGNTNDVAEEDVNVQDTTPSCGFVNTKVRVRELDRDSAGNFLCSSSSPANCRDWVQTTDSNISRKSFDITAFQCLSDVACDDVANNVILTVNGGGYSNQQFVINSSNTFHRLPFITDGVITVTGTTPNKSGAGCTGTATYTVSPGNAVRTCGNTCGPNYNGDGKDSYCEPGTTCALIVGKTSFACSEGSSHNPGSVTYPAGTFGCVPSATAFTGSCGKSGTGVWVNSITYDKFKTLNPSTCKYTGNTGGVNPLPTTSISTPYEWFVATGGFLLLVLGLKLSLGKRKIKIEFSR